MSGILFCFLKLNYIKLMNECSIHTEEVYFMYVDIFEELRA